MLDSLRDIGISGARIILLVAVAALVVIGVVMVFSSTSVALVAQGLNPFEDVMRQLAYIVAGILIMILIWQAIPYRAWLGWLLWVYYGLCMLMLVLTFLIGTEVNGAKRWLYFGPVGFQPSEFVKIALLLMSIKIVYNWRVGKIEWRAALVQSLLVVVPLVFMYATQSDLGTAIICVVGVYAALWLSGMSRRVLIGILIGIIVAVVLAVIFVGYRSSRFVYLNPWDDGQGGLGSGYNIIHSYYAIAEGGLFGKGLGSSHEKYDYLFAADSDFIFAIICEELGFVGAIVVIALFFVVLWTSFRIARLSIDEFGLMLAGSLAIMLVFQAFLNIGCAIGVFPTTGKPLPFISSGGSSVISSLMSIGIILSVGKIAEEADESKRNRDNLRVISYNRPEDRTSRRR